MQILLEFIIGIGIYFALITYVEKKLMLASQFQRKFVTPDNKRRISFRAVIAILTVVFALTIVVQSAQISETIKYMVNGLILGFAAYAIHVTKATK